MVAAVAVADNRAVAVIKDVADTNTTGKAVGAKVHTIKGTKVPSTKTTRALVTKAVGAGPTTADPTTSYTFHRYRSLPILNIAHFAHKVHLTSIFAVAQLYSLPW